MLHSALFTCYSYLALHRGNVLLKISLIIAVAAALASEHVPKHVTLLHIKVTCMPMQSHVCLLQGPQDSAAVVM